MKIVDLICAPGRTGFYFDDRRAIRSAGHDGMFYTGDPVTPGLPLCAAGGRVHFRDAGAGRGRADRSGRRVRSRAGTRRRRPGPLFLAEEFIP